MTLKQLPVIEVLVCGFHRFMYYCAGINTISMLQLLEVYFFLLFPHLIPRDDNLLLWCVYGFGGGQGMPIFQFCFSHISLPEMITAYFGVYTVLGMGRVYQYFNLAFPTFLNPK